MVMVIKAGILVAGLLVLIYSALMVVVDIVVKVRQWRRRRLVDRRVKDQAMALGVWDKYPIVLGGRALELKAWQDFKIKRQPGEPDAHLRRRCMNAADNEYVAAKITVCKTKNRRNRR